MMRSLHARLMFGTTTASVLLAGLASISLYLLVRQALFAEFDRSLTARVQMLASLVEQDGDRVEIDIQEHFAYGPEQSEPVEYFRLWGADGRVLAKSPELGEEDLPRIDVPIGHPAVELVSLPGGKGWRLAAMSFFPSTGDLPDPGGNADPGQIPEPPLTLAVARTTDAVEAALAKLGGLLLGVWLVTIALIPATQAIVLRITLKPVRRLAAAIEGIDETQLSERFEAAAIPDELAPIVQRLNELMDRLESAFSRERTFTADAAHELRTPLTGLRATLEMALTHDRDASDYRQAMQTCLPICLQMQSLVETLLTLARLDETSHTATRSGVSIERLLHECWQYLESRSLERELSVRWNVDPELVVMSDETKLRVILRNILENAVVHTNDRGWIDVVAAEQDGMVEICVTNAGSPLCSENIGRVFDRFWRADPARAINGRNAGLGLSVCKRLSDVIGCEISARSLPSGDFSLRLRFPENPNRRNERSSTMAATC